MIDKYINKWLTCTDFTNATKQTYKIGENESTIWVFKPQPSWWKITETNTHTMSCGILQKVKWFWDFFQIRFLSNTFKRLRNVNLVRNPHILVVMKTSTFQQNYLKNGFVTEVLRRPKFSIENIYFSVENWTANILLFEVSPV